MTIENKYVLTNAYEGGKKERHIAINPVPKTYCGKLVAYAVDEKVDLDDCEECKEKSFNKIKSKKEYISKKEVLIKMIRLMEIFKIAMEKRDADKPNNKRKIPGSF